MYAQDGAYSGENTVKLNQIPTAIRSWLLVVNTILFALFVWVASDAADGLRYIANELNSVALQLSYLERL